MHRRAARGADGGAGQGRNHEHLHARRDRDQPRKDLQPAASGHVGIQHQDVDVGALHEFQRLFSACRAAGEVVVRKGGNEASQAGADEEVVVGDGYAERAGGAGAGHVRVSSSHGESRGVQYVLSDESRS